MRQEEDFDANLAGEDNAAGTGKIKLVQAPKKEFSLLPRIRKMHQRTLGKMSELQIYLHDIWTLQKRLLASKCDFHHRIGSHEYFEILFDNNQYTELFENIQI